MINKKNQNEICSILKYCQLIKSGVNSYDGKKEYVATGDIESSSILDTTRYSYASKPSRANMSVKMNDVLFARMKNTTKVLLISSNESKFIFSTGFAVLRPDTKKIKPEYLMHVCKSKEFQKSKDRFAFGGTQKAINNNNISKLQISVPLIEEQNDIIDILNGIECIKANRIKTFDLIQHLAKSYFTKTYQLNTKKGFEETIENICIKIKRYPTFYGLKYVEHGTPVIKIGNISKDGKLQDDLAQYNFIKRETSNKFPETILEYHDLLMAVRGDGSAGKIGYVSDKKFIGSNISPNLLRIKVDNKKANPIFMYYLLSSDYGQCLINSVINRTAKKPFQLLILNALKYICHQ